MKFGAALPTCVEGMVYPLPFAGPHEILDVARQAEDLGYHSVLANDHFSTQAYVRNTHSVPPNYYDPLVILSACALVTQRIQLMTGVVVLPIRDPAVLAKQAATLDHLSRGRVAIGVGVGAYREEFEAMRPQWRGVRRSQLMDEGLACLIALFSQRDATVAGSYYGLDHVEMYPKPVQLPLPIYSCGNAPATIERAARHCQGWMPAGLGADRLRAGVATLTALAEEAGRDPDSISVAPQLVVCLGQTEAAAGATFEASGVYKHLISLRRATLRHIDLDAYRVVNLIGTPADVCDRIGTYQAAGADHLPGLIFVANSLTELQEQMSWFARDVIAQFPTPGQLQRAEG